MQEFSEQPIRATPPYRPPLGRILLIGGAMLITGLIGSSMLRAGLAEWRAAIIASYQRPPIAANAKVVDPRRLAAEPAAFAGQNIVLQGDVFRMSAYGR